MYKKFWYWYKKKTNLPELWEACWGPHLAGPLIKFLWALRSKPSLFLQHWARSLPGEVEAKKGISSKDLFYHSLGHHQHQANLFFPSLSSWKSNVCSHLCPGSFSDTPEHFQQGSGFDLHQSFLSFKNNPDMTPTVTTWKASLKAKPDICARGRYTAAADRPASCSIPAGEWATEQQEGKLKGFCILSGKCFLWEILLFFGEISWPVKDLTYWQISPVVVKAPVPANTVPCGYIWTVPEHDNVMSQTSWDYCTIDIKDIRI